MDEDDKKWMSFHIYLKSNFNKFLIECVFPICSYLLKKNKVISFFFIRYSEDGPHIRLRLLVNNDRDVEKFIPQALFTKFKSFDDLLKIRTVNYEREISRYGNSLKIMRECENHFQSSSMTVLETLPQINRNSLKWSKSLDLTVLLLLSTGIHNAEIGKIMSKYLNFWLSNLLPRNPSLRINDIDKSFRNIEQKLLEKYSYLSLFYREEYFFEDNVLSNWYFQSKKIFEEIIYRSNSSSIEHIKNYHNLITSLVHMNNNRMGNNNIEECFIYYSVYRIFEYYGEN